MHGSGQSGDIAEVWSSQKEKDIPRRVENTRITPAKEGKTYHLALVDQATGSQMSTGGNQVMNPNGSGGKERSRQQK